MPHVLSLATGALSDAPDVRYGVLVAGALLFAVGWRHVFGRGPLEGLIAGCGEASSLPPNSPESRKFAQRSTSGSNT